MRGGQGHEYPLYSTWQLVLLVRSEEVNALWCLDGVCAGGKEARAMNHLLNTITTGDAQLLSTHIPDNSIDLIFTDPPYDRDSLSLYEWLAEFAARALKPGGFL